MLDGFAFSVMRALASEALMRGMSRRSLPPASTSADCVSSSRTCSMGSSAGLLSRAGVATAVHFRALSTGEGGGPEEKGWGSFAAVSCARDACASGPFDMAVSADCAGRACKRERIDTCAPTKLQ